LTVMTAGHFMYPATDPGSAAERPEFLVYLPWVTIAIGIAWTMFSPTNRGLRWILLGVFFGSSAAYWAFGPWWGMGVSTGGSYLIQGLRFLTEPPKPAIKR
ncbi:MAG: hypothetical protein ACREUF_14255, partial [Solimonas sp.]